MSYDTWKLNDPDPDFEEDENEEEKAEPEEPDYGAIYDQQMSQNYNNPFERNDL